MVETQTIFFISFIVLLAILLLFIYIKDAGFNRKMKTYEYSIEDINKKIFMIEQKIKKQNLDTDIDTKEIDNPPKSSCKKKNKSITYKDRIVSMYESGHSIDEISKRVDVKKDIIKSILTNKP